MKSILFMVMFLFVTQPIVAQVNSAPHSTNGMVFDDKTKTPLSFATIVLTDSILGLNNI